MVRVRLENGTVLEYPQANYLVRGQHSHGLWTIKDGTCVAVVPLSAVVEFARPTVDGQTVNDMADRVITDIRNVNGANLRRLKFLLRNFDLRTYQWRR